MNQSSIATLRPATIDAEARASTATRRAVLFITMHFPPSREIGAHACEQIARYFPSYGWHPVVLTRPRRLIESLDPSYRRQFPGSIVEAGTLPHPISIYRRIRNVQRRDSGNAAAAGRPVDRRNRRLHRRALHQHRSSLRRQHRDHLAAWRHARRRTVDGDARRAI